MALHYILNKGDGQDAVIVADEREGIDAEAAFAAYTFAGLYRVAVVHTRDGERKEYWEHRYEGRWFEIDRWILPSKLTNLSASIAPRMSPASGDSKEVDRG